MRCKKTVDSIATMSSGPRKEDNTGTVTEGIAVSQAVTPILYPLLLWMNWSEKTFIECLLCLIPTLKRIMACGDLIKKCSYWGKPENTGQTTGPFQHRHVSESQGWRSNCRPKGVNEGSKLRSNPRNKPGKRMDMLGQIKEKWWRTLAMNRARDLALTLAAHQM